MTVSFQRFLTLTGMFLVTAIGVEAVNAEYILNGDFETGDFTGWNTFVNGAGLLSEQQVVLFDTNNDSIATNSAQFRVGLNNLNYPNPYSDVCGIYQTITATGGLLTLSADVASYAPGSSNVSGGRVDLLLDGIILSSHDFGFIDGGSVERTLLTHTTSVTAGVHEVRIQFFRRGITMAFTPYQIVDNIAVVQVVPSPSSLTTLVGVGLIVVGIEFRKRRRSAG